MAITYEVFDWFYSTFNVTSPRTATSLSFQNGDVITHIATFADTGVPGTPSISSTGSVNAGDLTWTQFVSQTTSGGCHIFGWWAISGATETRSITTSWSSGNSSNLSTFTIRHAGARTTNPVPAGNVFTGGGASSVTQSITPTASGSALWLIAANGLTTGTSNTTAGTNCTLVVDYAYDTSDVAVIRPTTQPRTDGSAFTLAETHTGSGVTWVAFEVVAAGAAQSQAPRSLHQYSMRHAA